MKEKNNGVLYQTKGELLSYEGGVMEVLQKKGKAEVTDEIDFNDMMIEINKFCEENNGKQVVIKMTAVASE